MRKLAVIVGVVVLVLAGCNATQDQTPTFFELDHKLDNGRTIHCLMVRGQAIGATCDWNHLK